MQLVERGWRGLVIFRDDVHAHDLVSLPRVGRCGNFALCEISEGEEVACQRGVGNIDLTRDAGSFNGNVIEVPFGEHQRGRDERSQDEQ